MWTKCIQEGVMTKQELDQFMKEKGIWSEGKEKEQEELVQAISDIEKELYLGGGKGKSLKLSEAKEKALEMRRTRASLRELLSEKISLESNTAESLSENAKFDYMVAGCTFHEDGQKVYSSLEDYEQRSDDDIAFMAASTLAELLYSVNKDFEEKLPENRFLKKFNMVNEDLSLVNADGVTVDTKGNRIDDEGRYLDRDGNRIDIDGNPLDEDGNYIPQLEYVDDLGLGIEDESKAESKEVERPKPEKKKEETVKIHDKTDS